MKGLTGLATDRPKLITGLMVVTTVVLVLLALLPTLFPAAFPALHPVVVDTDPENMLAKDAEVRVFHHEMKEAFSQHDMVVLGVVNEVHPEGVFNPDSLRRIYELTEFAKTLQWDDPDHPGERAGVVAVDMIAPSLVDNIEPGGPGEVRFEWLMAAPPETLEEAVAIRRKAERIPFLKGTMLSDDGKALAIYLPLTSKDLSYRVASRLEEKIATFDGDDDYYITGLPVAEDTFGVEMFKQMAISAPVAMLIIFLLMLFFFRKLALVVPPLIVAMVSVFCTMGLLVATGNTIHIMSSMIPIFIMPIAVLDAIHILSDFFDRYQETKDRRKTVHAVMKTLSKPMLFTSLTTAAGFGSLALTPIPPVQVFGLFVAFGVLVAWFWTITFVPAAIMFIRPESLENFGLTPGHEAEQSSPMSRMLVRVGKGTHRFARPLLIVVLLLVLVAGYGVSRIQINDNPIKWFHPRHSIRVADRVLNEHFGGTYMGFLTLGKPAVVDDTGFAGAVAARLEAAGAEPSEDAALGPVFTRAAEAARTSTAATLSALLDELEELADGQAWDAPDDQVDAWEALLAYLRVERGRLEPFKDPAVLGYIGRLQERLLKTGIVGKSNSLADIVKTVHRELFEGKVEAYRIPDSAAAVAQTLITYQNSHRPQDLWHFVTPDYTRTSLWIQLRSGDNRDMAAVVRAIDEFVEANPPPTALEHDWFGLTYINVIWQDKMVSGMLQAFLGSFLVVLLMMIFLFRSGLWGLLSMIPLTVTIGIIYGVIGLIGKDYDMPVAVLSSLSLGLAVDYAIHFLARSRELYTEHGSWDKVVGPLFGEPARAITRNVIVVGVGFLPLLLAPLVPYQTVGTFIAAILLTAGVASLLILPALMTVLARWLFPVGPAMAKGARCVTCGLTAVAAVALVALNVQQFTGAGWSRISVFSVAAVGVLLGACALAGRRGACDENAQPTEGE